MNISKDKEYEYISVVLKRYFPNIYDEYGAFYYPLIGKHQWLNRKTGMPIEDENLREQLDNSLNSLIKILHDLLFYVESGYITKEDIMKLFNEDSGQ